MKVAVIKDESSREYVLKSSDFWGKKDAGIELSSYQWNRNCRAISFERALKNRNEIIEVSIKSEATSAKAENMMPLIQRIGRICVL